MLLLLHNWYSGTSITKKDDSLFQSKQCDAMMLFTSTLPCCYNHHLLPAAGKNTAANWVSSRSAILSSFPHSSSVSQLQPNTSVAESSCRGSVVQLSLARTKRKYLSWARFDAHIRTIQFLIACVSFNFYKEKRTNDRWVNIKHRCINELGLYT